MLMLESRLRAIDGIEVWTWRTFANNLALLCVEKGFLNAKFAKDFAKVRQADIYLTRLD